MLNILFVAFILLAVVVALVRTLYMGDASILSALTPALFDSAKTAFDIAIGLVGIMSLWLGLLAVAEAAGLTQALARALAPLFRRLFPDIPEGHPALGAITMNIAANMLGLDNAATPLGLRAMQELQSLNPSPETATRAQTLFMVINTASVTIFPVVIIAYRAQLGAHAPADIFVPLLLASSACTVTGILLTMIVQKQRVLDPVLLLWTVGLGTVLAALSTWLLRLPAALMPQMSTLVGQIALIGFIGMIFVAAAWRRVAAFDVFVGGARQGFDIALRILPYLVGMLAAISLLRASGVLDLILQGTKRLVAAGGWDTRWVDGLPVALMRTLSGGGSRAMMIDVMKASGADSFAGHLVSILQGSSETTFYVLAVYFGSVGIRRARTAVACALTADLIGFIASVLVCYLFFG